MADGTRAYPVPELADLVLSHRLYGTPEGRSVTDGYLEINRLRAENAALHRGGRR